MSAPTDNDCARCGLALHNYSEATDCRMCDPLCPVFGTHGELWDGDEETSRAAYLAGQERASKVTAARAALDALTGPERIETLRHYAGSAKKAIAANSPSEYDDSHEWADDDPPAEDCFEDGS